MLEAKRLFSYLDEIDASEFLANETIHKTIDGSI